MRTFCVRAKVLATCDRAVEGRVLWSGRVAASDVGALELARLGSGPAVGCGGLGF